MRKNMILFYFVISNFTPYQQTIESDYNKNFSIKLFSYSDIKKVKKPTFHFDFHLFNDLATKYCSFHLFKQ